MEVTPPGSAFPLQEVSEVGTVRRAALRLAEHLRFSESRAGQVALVATELATNLAKHARGGVMLLQSIPEGTGEDAGIEILSLDRGPGMPNVPLSRTDGFSTAGTLGHGLGAAERQSDGFDLFTRESGTAILARIHRTAPPQHRPKGPRFVVGGVAVNAPGEQVCGDGWAASVRDAQVTLMIADGLGHGLAAHEASRQAIASFNTSSDRRPGEILADVHEALRATRGAAVTALSIDIERGIVRCAGIGNVSAVILPPGDGVRRALISYNGTAGHGVVRPREAQYPFPAHALVVMHSDGLHARWDLDAYPGLRQRHPTLVAGVLYRDFARPRDDVSVVVVAERLDGSFP